MLLGVQGIICAMHLSDYGKLNAMQGILKTARRIWINFATNFFQFSRIF